MEQRVAKGGQFAEAWPAAFVSDKFGESTTHWRNFQDRVQRGVGNPCPLLLIGLPAESLRSRAAINRIEPPSVVIPAKAEIQSERRALTLGPCFRRGDVEKLQFARASSNYFAAISACE